MMTDEDAQAQAQAHAKAGNLVEAGWIMALLKGAPDDLPPAELAIIRGAFFAGARHMLALMAGAYQRDTLDMQKLVDDLRAELDRFRNDLGPKTPH
jgi:hypothetical protein